MKKNAPFVDSHDYSTFEKLVGKVIDFRVDARKGQLVNRFQWAVDVPDNQLAQLGWKMTESGYLKRFLSNQTPHRQFRQARGLDCATSGTWTHGG